jgi:hypothetical protein
MSPGSAAASFLALLLLGAGGCAALDDQTDYHRHTMSDLRDDRRQPGVLLFEATSSSQYPADSGSAEAVRMEWLAGWMKRGGHCPDGWEVTSRSVIPPAEVHMRRHDLRYEVKCVGAAAPPVN